MKRPITLILVSKDFEDIVEAEAFARSEIRSGCTYDPLIVTGQQRMKRVNEWFLVKVYAVARVVVSRDDGIDATRITSSVRGKERSKFYPLRNLDQLAEVYYVVRDGNGLERVGGDVLKTVAERVGVVDDFIA